MDKIREELRWAKQQLFDCRLGTEEYNHYSSMVESLENKLSQSVVSVEAKLRERVM